MRFAAPTSLAVDAAPASQFSITAPSTVNAGVPFNVVVTALDQYGNTVTNYVGTVDFSSSDTDPSVMLPLGYTFVAADQGVHTFVGGFILVTPGPQTLTATDTANAAITGTARSWFKWEAAPVALPAPESARSFNRYRLPPRLEIYRSFNRLPL